MPRIDKRQCFAVGACMQLFQDIVNLPAFEIGAEELFPVLLVAVGPVSFISSLDLFL